jgi:UDP:flavonoid glycosyltransferase YjiC (YdhE family)
MRILFSSKGLMGHLLPLLPFAHALKKSGNEILVATPENMAATLREEGLDHAKVDEVPNERLKEIWASAISDSSEDLLTAAGKLFAYASARSALSNLRNAVGNWRPDIIVRDSAEYAASIAAAQAGIPIARVAVNTAYTETEMLRIATAPIDFLREEAGLVPDNGTALQAEPIFTFFPPSFERTATLANASVPFRVQTKRHSKGELPLPEWAHPDERPLIFITFGTLAQKSKKFPFLIRSTLQAVASLPIRALLSTGTNLDFRLLGTVADNVIVRAWVRQCDIYPHAAALVCHGGSGTILAGLAHELPMVVIPIAGDQPENGQRIEMIGGGIVIREPDVSQIRSAISSVLFDIKFRSAAAKISKEIAGLNSIDAAAIQLQQIGYG